MQIKFRALLILVGCCLLMSMEAIGQNISISPFRKGVKVPVDRAFNPRTSKGKEVNRSTMDGKVVLFHTWSTERDVLKKEYTKILQRMYRGYGRAGLVMYSVSMDKDKRQADRNARSAGFKWGTICDGHGSELVKGAQKGTITPSMGFYFNGKTRPKAFIIKENVCVWAGSLEGIEAELKILYPKVKLPPMKKGSGDKNNGDDNSPTDGNASDAVNEAIDALKEALRLMDLDKDFTGALKEIETISDKVLGNPQVVREALAVIVSLKPFGENKTSVVLALRENEKGKQKLQKMTASAIAILAIPLETSPKNRPGKQRPSGSQVSPLEALAKRQLDQSKKLIAAGRKIEAYRILKELSRRYRKTKAGKEALSLLTSYENDKAFLATYKKAEMERKAKSKLRLAEGYAKTKQTKLAKHAYEDIIDDYPDTEAAKLAEEALKALAG